MNLTFQHFKQAVKFIMCEFELTHDEATSFVLESMFSDDNKLTVDISPLAFGTYGHAQ